MSVKGFIIGFVIGLAASWMIITTVKNTQKNMELYLMEAQK